MPKVNGKSYAYTSAGKALAAEEKNKMAKKLAKEKHGDAKKSRGKDKDKAKKEDKSKSKSK